MFSPTVGNGSFISHCLGMGVFNLSDTSHKYKMQIEQPADTVLASTEVTIADLGGFQLQHLSTTDMRGSTVRFKFVPASGETNALFKGDNIECYNQVNVLDLGIYESAATEADVNVIVKVDSVTVTTINSVTESYESSTDIDLTDYITTTGWHTIYLQPSDEARLVGNGYVKCFIESK
jgi:hypothetical protein